MAEIVNGEPPRVQLYRLLLNDKTPGVADKIKKYSFSQFENNLLNNEDAQKELGWYLESKNIVSDPIDFSERYLQAGVKTPPTPKPKPVPAQQFPVGIAAPESIKGAVPSVTDIGREMAFKPAVQQPIEPVDPVEPIGVMAPEPIVEPAPSVTDVAREMAFKPPVQPKMPKEEEMSPLETAGQKVMEFASGFNRALFKAPSSVVKTASELGVGVINMLGGDMQSEDAVLYSLADKYDKWLDTSEVAKKWIGKPEYTGLATDVGSGLGQIASMVAAGPQGASQALLKTPTVLKAVSQQMFSKPSLIAFSQVFNSEFENMKAKGESEQTAFNQGLTNALATSPLENLPLINLAERLNKTIGVKLARRVLNALQQGAEEGGQEAVQQVFSNLTNNQLVESEQNIVDWAQGIQPSAEAGGVVGLLIGGLANAKAARGYSKTSGLNKFSDNVVNNEIIQEAARGYGDNITKAEQQGKKPDSFNQKQLKKIAENPEAWVRDEIKYIQQTIESNKTLGLDSKVEENSLAKATSLLNQIKAEKKSMEQADIAPAQEAVPVAPEAEVIAPEPIAPEVAPVAEEVPFEEVPAETEDELAFLDKMRLTPEEEAAILAQEGIIPAAPVAPAEEVIPEVTPEVVPEVVPEVTPDVVPEQVAPAEEVVAAAPAPKAEPAKTNEEQIADLRAEEQAELDSRIKNADKYRGEDGKVDRTKLTKKADIKAFNEVYDKYDKLISPLMETKPKPKKDEKGKEWTPPSKPDDINTFPLLKGIDVVRYIPESVAQKAWEVWDKEYQTGQSLQRTKERGGFGVNEMDMFYSNWRQESNKINTETSKETPKAKEEAPKPEPKKEEGEKPAETKSLSQKDIDKEIQELGDAALRAKKNIGSADDVEAAVKEYNKAKKALDDFEKGISEEKARKESDSNIENLVEEEKEQYEKQGDKYPWKEQFDRDPRLAALEEAKDFLAYLKEDGTIEYSAKRTNATIEEAKKQNERSIENRERDIKDLNESLKRNPPKTKAETEFTSQQSSEAATAFDKTKTSKGFDKKYGKGAYKALSDITKNFEDIMDGMSGKIKQDCL